MSKSARIDNVSVIGAGVIGMSWATLFIAKGLNVNVFDPAPESTVRLKKFVDRTVQDVKKANNSLCRKKGYLRVCSSVKCAVEGVYFIQENGPECIECKHNILSEIERYAESGAIIASSTSSIMPSILQKNCEFPERVLVGHPYNPPHLIPLVEVVGGEKSSYEKVMQAMRFYKNIGKIPIHVRKEAIGHVANRLTAALYREAVYIVQEGISSVRDVDTAITNGPGLRWAIAGPHLLYHLAGGEGGLGRYLDRLGDTQERRWEDLGAPKLDDFTKQMLIHGVHEEIGFTDIETLTARRDKCLLNLLALLRKQGPLIPPK